MTVFIMLSTYFNPRSHEGSDSDNVSLCKHPHISIHAPTRGATCRGRAGSAGTCDFNPRSHEGSDVKRMATYEDMQEFQSTLPRGERLSIRVTNETSYFISIHAPTRGATKRVTHPFYIHGISIHAPTRGATVSGIFVYNIVSISIHAPTRGATPSVHIPQQRVGFQSTLPRGERLKPPHHFLISCQISIHAPTRGAT